MKVIYYIMLILVAPLLSKSFKCVRYSSIRNLNTLFEAPMRLAEPTTSEDKAPPKKRGRYLSIYIYTFKKIKILFFQESID